MARYGATPLVLGKWYHVAGVYNAEAETLDVYLNGKLDNGFLLGRVTGAQHSSLSAVYVGRRSDAKGFEFAGSLDDVRIYSLPLTKDEIAAEMQGNTIAPSVSNSRDEVRPKALEADCTVLSEPEDARIPGAAASFGVLVAIACIALLPSAASVLWLVISSAAGLLLVPAMASTLPPSSLWMMPLVSLAGGASVGVSVRRLRI